MRSDSLIVSPPNFTAMLTAENVKWFFETLTEEQVIGIKDAAAIACSVSTFNVGSFPCVEDATEWDEGGEEETEVTDAGGVVVDPDTFCNLYKESGAENAFIVENFPYL